jgi:hypothetical protein
MNVLTNNINENRDEEKLKKVLDDRLINDDKNENDYNRAQSDKKYTRAIVKELKVPGEKPVLNRDDLNEAEKRMPGLKRFLGITNEE